MYQRLDNIDEHKVLSDSKKCSTLGEMKRDLDEAKQMYEMWQGESSSMKKICFESDPYKCIKKQMNSLGIKNVSNAWLKYYELVQAFRLIDPNCTVFFNAELPGSGIKAVNYFAKNVKGINIDWIASSFIDKSDPSILGDIYGIYRNNRDKWLMNDVYNGDMTSLDNLMYLKSLNIQVDLYMHDAGTDICDNQELAMHRLHLGCAIAGLVSLKKGGHFVAKQFTFFEPCTYELIMIYISLFSEFYICKPFASRDRNSEIYLVGKGFKGMTDSVFNDLIHRFNHPPQYASSDISQSAIGVALIEFASNICTTQIREIQHIFNLLCTPLSRKQKIKMRKMNEAKRSEWYKYFPVYPMKPGLFYSNIERSTA